MFRLYLSFTEQYWLFDDFWKILVKVAHVDFDRFEVKYICIFLCNVSNYDIFICNIWKLSILYWSLEFISSSLLDYKEILYVTFSSCLRTQECLLLTNILCMLDGERMEEINDRLQQAKHVVSQLMVGDNWHCSATSSPLWFKWIKQRKAAVETRHNLGNALYQSFEVVLELQVSNRLQDDELKTTFEGKLPRQVNVTISWSFKSVLLSAISSNK